jgi:multiple sugar transport system ATP-binding protein
MGSELYVHFTVDSDQSIESQELRELAEDAGGGEVPSAGEEGRIVARLDPASNVTEGQDAELWVDATRLILFDPEDGRNLTTERQGPPATRGQSPAGREPEAATEGDTQVQTGFEGEPRPGATGGQR